MTNFWLVLSAGAAAALVPPMHQVGSQTGSPGTEADAVAELIELQNDRHNRLTVPVLIDGQGPFDFMIDTGSQATIVSRELSEQLQLEKSGEATLVGIASSRTVDLVELNSLELGERMMGPLTAPLLERANVGADGIVGLDSLQNLRVLIDFRDNTMAIVESPERASTRGYEIVVRANRVQGRMIIANARIDGVRTSVIIDTGAEGSIGNAALKSRLRARGREQMTASDVHGAEINGNMDFADRLKIGAMELRLVPINYADAPVFEALDMADRPALILGMEELRSLDRVAIDFTTNRVLFDVPTGYLNQGLLRQKFFPSRIRRD